MKTPHKSQVIHRWFFRSLSLDYTPLSAWLYVNTPISWCTYHNAQLPLSEAHLRLHGIITAGFLFRLSCHPRGIILLHYYHNLIHRQFHVKNYLCQPKQKPITPTYSTSWNEIYRFINARHTLFSPYPPPASHLSTRTISTCSQCLSTFVGLHNINYATLYNHSIILILLCLRTVAHVNNHTWLDTVRLNGVNVADWHNKIITYLYICVYVHVATRRPITQADHLVARFLLFVLPCNFLMQFSKSLNCLQEW